MMSINFMEAVGSAIKLPELRQRILFVFAMFGVYAVGLHIPVPGVNHERLKEIIESNAAWQFMNLFTGGALKRFAVLALGLNPYITSSIIMQVMSYTLPQLRALQKEGGEAGRRQIAKYTRYLTLVVAFLQALGLITVFRNNGALETGGLWITLYVILALIAGAMFLLWLGEQITEKGIGQGVSLMIFASIVATIPGQIASTVVYLQAGTYQAYQIIALLAIFLITVWSVVYVTQSQRRIPIQHVRRIIGRRQTMGGASYLPIPVNAAGVMPIIFAMALQSIPVTLASAFTGRTGWVADAANWIAQHLSPGYSWFGAFFFAFLIFAFTYVYISIIFNTDEIADNLKKQGSFVQGIRPGNPTKDFLDGVVSRITVFGASFLAIIALMQYMVPNWTGVQTFALGGTSLLIMVGVGLDFLRQIESQMSMRQYEDFLR